MGIDQQRPEESLRAFELQVQRLSPDLVVFLMGSSHAQRKDADRAKRNFVALVSASAPMFAVQRFFMVHAGGTAWNCQVTCTVHRYAGLPQLAPRTSSVDGLYLWSRLEAENGLRSLPKNLLDLYDGVYWLEQVSYSSPLSAPTAQ